MIKKLSDLLRQVQAAEAERLDQHRITHGPTIGTMYEGLTKDLVDQVIPQELDIRVVDGFIEGIDKKLSPQADILIVRGEGERIPHTQSFIYPIQKVLAVFEIKKTLGGVSLDDAMAKMSAVLQLYKKSSNFPGPHVDLEPAVRGFAYTTGKWPQSDEEATKLSEGLPAIFDIFKLEQMAPLRIIWGYGGYSSEKSLRTGFVGRMNAAVDKSHFGPWNLPSLIVAGQNSLVKMVGQPYSSRLVNGWWNVLTSNAENPVRLLLEMLWTKISLDQGVTFPMDDTLQMERLATYLRTKFTMQAGEVVMTEFDHVEITKKQLHTLPVVEWSPEEQSLDEVVLLMGAGGGLDVTSPSLNQFAADEGFDLRLLIDRLVEKRQLAWTSDTTLRPTGSTTITTFSPAGTISAGSNADLMSLWLNKNS
ncbi:MAG: hypothetical protein Q7K25_03085 [Actinomycetota bacterium]|nr:hypothetical protein [Actinomycetota bacterium]